jgi:hypothetical protein
MPRLTRRSLLLLAARIAAALGLAGAASGRAAASAETSARDTVFPAPLLAALGEALLPAELGGAGLEAALQRFVAWVQGYRVGAELNHAYPAAAVARLLELPLRAWQQQLAALDTAARIEAPGGFVALDRAARQLLITTALPEAPGEVLPPPAEAAHIATALLAHFYQSPQATDLCYRAAIGRLQCRPLDGAVPRPPVAGAAA